MVGIDKMSLCSAFEGVNSSLLLMTSSPREQLSQPWAGARFDPPSYQASNLVSKPSVKADRLSENQRKKRGAFAFSGDLAAFASIPLLLRELRGLWRGPGGLPLGRACHL